VEQYGFRTKSTTDKATYTLTNEILKALNNKLIVGVIFCDLEKAFGCVNHDILLSKLEFCGVTGRDNVLYKSYLNDRYQRVLIYNENHSSSTLSNWAKMKHGVPQGSILGPLLFLLYMNDLPEIINNKSLLILFADDTSILFIHSNLTNYNKDIHAVFKLINKWFKGNFLSLNFEKNTLYSFHNQE
jgi:hypothetical protein